MSAASCFHCAEPVPRNAPTVQWAGAAQPVCCAGCAAAALWIRDAGLAEYYRLRDATPDRAQADATDWSAWDRPELLAGHVMPVGELHEVTVQAEGMRCAACAWLIDRALQREPGVAEVAANAVTGRVRLRWDPATTRLSTVLSRLAALGYRANLSAGAALERERTRQRRSLLLRLGVAGLGAMQAMMFTEALYLDVDQAMPLATRDFFRWVAFLLCAPVVFYSGWPFIAGMLGELRARRLGMDTAIASAVLLAYGASLVETLRGGPHVWFDAAVMFVFLLLAARFLEQVARQRAGARIEALSRARPALATRLDGDGRAMQVPSTALAPGDLVRVAAGESVPADGVLQEAAGFDEALLTGEPRPVVRAAGDTVLAGSVCLGRPATIAVVRTGADTWLSHLVRLVERAQGARPRLARLADRVASRFVAALFAIAVVVFAGWWLAAGPARGFEVALAVLVVSCPCALSLAIPAALTAAHGALARIGVLSASPDALETLARVDTLVLDKTGTLTLGRPRMVAVEATDPQRFTPERAVQVAAALERDSGHPLGRAFLHGSESTLVATDVCASAGLGVEGTVEGARYRLGRPGFAASGSDDGRVWLGEGRRLLARFTLEDSLRPDARQAIAALQRQGLHCMVLSGDEPGAVRALATELGIQDARGRQSPGDKLEAVRDLQASGRVVAMLGDGINDAPVLAGADVSLALGGGAPLAHRAADLVVTGESLLRVPQAIALARRSRRIVRQNLGWAIGYNLLALPFAAAGLVAPWLAALGMAASSLLVTVNALRLARVHG